MQVYWVAMIVVLVAFILSLFFKTPLLRAKSALQEAADDAAAADAAKAAEREPVGAYASLSEDDDEEYDTGLLANRAANEFGALVEPEPTPRPPGRSAHGRRRTDRTYQANGRHLSGGGGRFAFPHLAAKRRNWPPSGHGRESGSANEVAPWRSLSPPRLRRPPRWPARLSTGG
ncbi:hypothetical protein ACRAWC_21980 [Leifsonia sp. L25]|uniref:hypothetical protein n=1 Tax=Leifsonia sp. L25 TaxID=3423957 RepID=UPI003D69D673